MKALRIATTCALAAASLSSQAAVVVADKFKVGDQGVLSDTATGLDWARGPTGLAGGDYDGFRLASADEVLLLFQDVGLKPELPSSLPGYVGDYDPLLSANAAAFDVLWFVWAPATSWSFSRGTRAQDFQVAGAPSTEGSFTFGELSISNWTGWMPPPPYSVTFAAFARVYTVSSPPPGAGRALVRAHVDVIPEPRTYALMMLGLAWLAFALRGRAGPRKGPPACDGSAAAV